MSSIRSFATNFLVEFDAPLKAPSTKIRHTITKNNKHMWHIDLSIFTLIALKMYIASWCILSFPTDSAAWIPNISPELFCVRCRSFKASIAKRMRVWFYSKFASRYKLRPLQVYPFSSFRWRRRPEYPPANHQNLMAWDYGRRFPQR
jgi:hypothetical protein